jgi:hypothetical protein
LTTILKQLNVKIVFTPINKRIQTIINNTLKQKTVAQGETTLTTFQKRNIVINDPSLYCLAGYGI